MKRQCYMYCGDGTGWDRLLVHVIQKSTKGRDVTRHLVRKKDNKDLTKKVLAIKDDIRRK